MRQKIAVVLAVLMILMSVPAMADDTKSGAQNLFENGFIQGSDTGLDEEKILTRAQAAKLLAQMYGKDSEAKMFLYTPKFLDVYSSDWYASYVGYANKNGWVSGYPGGTFLPNNTITKQEWAKMLIAALGYSYTWETVVDDLKSIGIEIPATDPNKLLRGEAFEAMWKAVNTNRAGKTMTLGQEFGMLPTPEPEEPEEPEVPEIPVIESVDLYSLKEIALIVNQPLKRDTVIDTDNYELRSAFVYDLKVLNADYDESNNKIILTFNKPVPQQTDIDLIMRNIYSADNQELVNDEFRTINIKDLEPPKIESLTSLGNRTIKITFSEPMATYDEAQSIAKSLPFEYGFTLNNGNIIVRSYQLQNLNKELIIETYNDLPETTTIVPKKNFSDYTPFNLLSNPSIYPMSVKVVKDTVAPVVTGYEDLSATGVTLVWSEDIKVLNGLATQFYHSSANYTVDSTVTSEKVDGNKLRLEFTRNFIPSGRTIVIVGGNAIQDYSGNRNIIQQTQIELAPDTQSPYVVGSATPVSEQRVELVVSEPLNNREGQVQNRQNYRLMNSSGNDVSGLIGNVVYNSSTNKIEVNFSEPLIGDYTLSISNLMDYSGNLMGQGSYAFEMRDFTSPNSATWTARLYNAKTSQQMIRIKFDEPMATDGKYSVMDVEKYTINGVSLDTLDESLLRMDMVDNDTTLEIYYPGAIVRGGLDFYADVNKDKNTQDDVVLARVADANNNYIQPFSVVLDLESKGSLAIESASLIDQNVVEVVISDALIGVEMADFRIEGPDGVFGITAYEMSYLDNNKTILTLKLNAQVVGDPADVTVQAINTNSVNRYGESLDTSAAPIALTDKMAPFVVETTFDGSLMPHVTYTESTGVVVIRFSEDINPKTVSLLSFSVSNYMVEDIFVSGREVRIVIAVEDRDRVQRFDSVTQNVEIRDLSGNGVTGLNLLIQKVY